MIGAHKIAIAQAIEILESKSDRLLTENEKALINAAWAFGAEYASSISYKAMQKVLVDLDVKDKGG